MGRFTLLDYLLDLSLNHIDNHFTNVNALNHGNPLQIKRKSEDLDTSKILLFFCKLLQFEIEEQKESKVGIVRKHASSKGRKISEKNVLFFL